MKDLIWYLIVIIIFVGGSYIANICGCASTNWNGNNFDEEKFKAEVRAEIVESDAITSMLIADLKNEIDSCGTCWLPLDTNYFTFYEIDTIPKYDTVLVQVFEYDTLIDTSYITHFIRDTMYLDTLFMQDSVMTTLEDAGFRVIEKSCIDTFRLSWSHDGLDVCGNIDDVSHFKIGALHNGNQFEWSFQVPWPTMHFIFNGLPKGIYLFYVYAVDWSGNKSLKYWFSMYHGSNKPWILFVR